MLVVKSPFIYLFFKLLLILATPLSGTKGRRNEVGGCKLKSCWRLVLECGEYYLEKKHRPPGMTRPGHTNDS